MAAIRRVISAFSPRHQWRRFAAMLVLLFVGRGVVLMCVMPPLEGWDEYQHVAYIVHLRETGREPVWGETNVPESVLRAAVRYPCGPFAGDQLGGAGALGHADYWRVGAPAYREGSGPVMLYQAQHPSLYYRAVGPIFAAAGGVERLGRSVAVLRAVNLGLGAAAVWIILARLGRWCHRASDAALVGLLIVLQPLLAINCVRVASDALAMLLATQAIAWAFELDGRRMIRRSAAIGLVIGLAILSKALCLVLVPFFVGCVAWLAVRRAVSPGRAVAAALAMTCGAGIVTQSYFRSNLARFGLLTPMQESIVNLEKNRTAMTRAAGDIDWGRSIRRLWLRDWLWAGGWSAADIPQRLRDAHEVTIDLSLVGWLFLIGRAARQRRVICPGGLLGRTAILVLCFAAGLAYHTLQTQAAWGRPATNSWYAAAAFPWLLLLIYQGAMGWPGSRLKLVLPLHLAWLSVASMAVGILRGMIPTYGGTEHLGEALRRIATLQPGWLGTATLAGSTAACVAMIAIAVAAWVAAVREESRPTPARDSAC